MNLIIRAEVFVTPTAFCKISPGMFARVRRGERQGQTARYGWFDVEEKKGKKTDDKHSIE